MKEWILIASALFGNFHNAVTPEEVRIPIHSKKISPKTQLIRVFLKLQAEKYLGLGGSSLGMIFYLFMGVNLFSLTHFCFFIVGKA